ncbi:MAG: hypothetical protein ACKVJE_21780 [Pseudomonadales bacterium]
MSEKSHAISVRLSQDDYEFLSSCDWNGASTLSEKIRELVALARKQAGLGKSPAALSGSFAEGIHVLMGDVHQIERDHGTHSDVMQNMFLLLPQLISALPQKTPFECEELSRSEKDLVNLMFRFFSGLMRLALTEQAPYYDPALIVNQFKAIKPTLDTLLSLPHIKSV